MVPYIDLKAQYLSLKPEIDEAMAKVMASGRFIGGEEVEKFEESMAAYLGVSHVISCGNGYDAIYMALKASGIGIGERILTDKYTHVSTHAAIFACGATPVFESDGDEMAWVPVHMNGRMQNIDYVPCGAVVEDACQALGASLCGVKAGTVGDIGCFSLHPMKVLGCAGDGGFMATNYEFRDTELRELRNHGAGQGYGVNSRLDNLQAAILNVKFPHLDRWIARRREIATIYHLEFPKHIEKPEPPSNGPHFDVYSSYVLPQGGKMLKHMTAKGIECFSHIKPECLSLPIYPEMKDIQIEEVIDAVKSF